MTVKLCVCGDYGIGKSSMIEIIFNNAHPKDVWKHYRDDQNIRTVSCLNQSITIIESMEPMADCDIIVMVLNAENYIENFNKNKEEEEWKGENMDKKKKEINWQLLSSNHHVNILLHRMDTIKGNGSIKKREMEIKKDALPMLVNVYATSIWDESLYRAWSNIIHPLSPLKGIELGLTGEIKELILFDAGTFLNVATISTITTGGSNNNNNKNATASLAIIGSNVLKSHRMEKISNISRQFRMNHTGQDRKRYEIKTINNDRLILELLNEYLLALVIVKEENMEEWTRIKMYLQEKLA